jgi:ADP-ribosylglycohydrolase
MAAAELCEKVLAQVDRRALEVDSGAGRYGEDTLNSFSIFDQVPPELKQEAIAAGAKDPACARMMGAMAGMALGDAYGHMYEFLPAVDAPLRAEFEKKGAQDSGVPYFDKDRHFFSGVNNTFSLALGQWTDDCSMGLCIADSYLATREFNGSDQRVRFWNWWNKGYNNAFRKDPKRSNSVGLGGNISKSLGAIRNSNPPPAYEAETEDAGNGSLMRFCPTAIMFRNQYGPVLFDCCRKASYTTHPGIIAAEACAFVGHVLQRAFLLEGPTDPKAFLDRVCSEYLETEMKGKSGWGYDQIIEVVSSKPSSDKEACWNWRLDTLEVQKSLQARGRSYNGYPVSAGYFGSYSVDGLAMALHVVYHNTDFASTVAHAVNLLGDADSTGSIAGQIAGALYGYNALPEEWMKNLGRWDEGEIALRGVLLWHLSK